MMDAEKMLRENILPFWLGLRDPAGGFFGEADALGNIHPEAERSTVLGARILWSFSASFRVLGDQAYADAARWALKDFTSRYIDADYGGAYWSVTAHGGAASDKKQLYAQAFSIYALSEAFRSLGEREALEGAVDLFRLVEASYRDLLHGGYTEALSRDFSPLEDMSLSENDINAAKTMNSHLHLMEAYVSLYRVWPDPSLEEALRTLAVLLMEKMVAQDGHLRLYFDSDWTVLPGPVSCGHDIETSWLLLECAEVLGDKRFQDLVRGVSLRLGRAGNQDLRPDGSLPGEWWTYAETVVGNLYLDRVHHESGASGRMERCWNYLCAHLVDWERGEWFSRLLPDGTPDMNTLKAGFWKCPYHNTRMCLEIVTGK